MRAEIRPDPAKAAPLAASAGQTADETTVFRVTFPVASHALRFEPSKEPVTVCYFDAERKLRTW